MQVWVVTYHSFGCPWVWPPKDLLEIVNKTQIKMAVLSSMLLITWPLTTWLERNNSMQPTDKNASPFLETCQRPVKDLSKSAGVCCQYTVCYSMSTRPCIRTPILTTVWVSFLRAHVDEFLQVESEWGILKMSFLFAVMCDDNHIKKNHIKNHIMDQ